MAKRKRKRISGIYRLYWKNCDHFYYGQTQDFKDRKRQHINSMKRNDHDNSRLQHTYDKYGEPYFEEVECCELELLTITEQKYIDLYFGTEFCCNLSPTAESVRGIKHSEEYCASVSRRRSGTKLSSEHKKNIGIGLKEAYKEGNRTLHFLGVPNPYKDKSHTEEEKLAMKKWHSENKRTRGKNPNAKVVLNFENGIFYDSAIDAFETMEVNYKVGLFNRKLNGDKKNNTKFIYA
jgi:group I intron endonuclease